MESAFLVDNIYVIGLEFHDPSGIECGRVLHLHQGFEGCVICDHLEWSPFKEMAEMIYSPNNSELFKLCGTIISDCSGIGSACITDDTFSVDLFSFSGVFPSHREILCKDCA